MKEVVLIEASCHETTVSTAVPVSWVSVCALDFLKLASNLPIPLLCSSISRPSLCLHHVLPTPFLWTLSTITISYCSASGKLIIHAQSVDSHVCSM